MTGAPGVAIGVALDGREVFARGRGLADVENNVEMSAASVMRIASISKPLTAALVARFVEQNRLRLDDSIYVRLDFTFSPRTWLETFAEMAARVSAKIVRWCARRHFNSLAASAYKRNSTLS